MDKKDVNSTEGIENSFPDIVAESVTIATTVTNDLITDTNVATENFNEKDTIEEIEIPIEEEICGDGSEVSHNNKTSDRNVQKLTHLPIARVKSIMKFDDDVNAASQEAVFLLTKATELFINNFMKEVYQCTVASKKKTVSKRDVDAAVFSQDYFLFLDGTLD
ncbi:DNA polymerase epsilon subunit 4-like [Lycorma delicatula]|uniref:DNA polymerase epsilon subunit 4-like n=1 Tax=Lycorma delicatula TaxID=130591 RepID=UPI003F51AA61